MMRRILYIAVILFFSGMVCVPEDACARSVSQEDGSSGSGHSSRHGKKKSKSSKHGRKKCHSSKHDKKKSHSSKHERSSSSGKFSASEIKRYRAMPYETWESPRNESELGLPITPGYAQPYPYGNLMRQFDGNKCRHRGLDIGAVGEENGGIGTVINAAVPSVITLIGKTGGDTREFGRLDKRSGYAKRTGKKYPRRIMVPGYGLVYPFSRNYGRWRSGTVIVTRVTDGPLKDYTVRYMHLAAVRPDLKVGSKIEAGEHIALMGGTAVMESWAHVHIDMSNPQGQRVDLAPYIGLPNTSLHCAKYKNIKMPPVIPESVEREKPEIRKTRKKKDERQKSGDSLIRKRPRSSYVGNLFHCIEAPKMRILKRR